MKFEAVGASTAYSCALATQGDVYCWGGNGAGQLGDGTHEVRAVPTRIAGLSDVVMLGRGMSYHACAVNRAGEVSCWGQNAAGQLGDGTQVERPTPVRVPAVPRAIQVRPGTQHTCALTEEGKVYCWGGGFAVSSSGSAVLGPLLIGGINDAVDLSVGAHHGCVRTRSGEVLCWGSNSEGQLGLGSVEPGKVYDWAVKASLVTWPVTELVSADDFRSCAVLSDQTARCWGGRQVVAQDLGVRGVASLSMSWTQVCALTLPDETVRCWSKQALELVSTRVVKGARKISAGDTHYCSVLVDNNIVCWGSNFSGALGRGNLDENTSDLELPVASM